LPIEEQERQNLRTAKWKEATPIPTEEFQRQKEEQTEVPGGAST
jgi:hypothetical protein